MKYCRKEDDVFYHMVMTNTNTKTKTKTKTKCIEDTTYAIFSKSREFKDIKYHHFITSPLHHFITSSLHHFIAASLHHFITSSQTRPDQTRDQTRPDQDQDQDRPGQLREDQRRLRSRGPNSRTCVLVTLHLHPHFFGSDAPDRTDHMSPIS